MIDCPCGGQTTPANAKADGARLDWQECGACGRCGLYSLHVSNVMVARGHAARRAFTDERLIYQIKGRASEK